MIFDQPDAKNIKSLNSDISFSNVSFKYEKDWVLNDVSLELKKGQTIALVGQSGSGKTTLADLLPRFYEPQKGQVKIDDVPINELSLKSLRSLLGIVTQESILFNDTIFNNIAFSVDNASKEDIENILCHRSVRAVFQTIFCATRGAKSNLSELMPQVAKYLELT